MAVDTKCINLIFPKTKPFLWLTKAQLWFLCILEALWHTSAQFWHRFWGVTWLGAKFGFQTEIQKRSPFLGLLTPTKLSLHSYAFHSHFGPPQLSFGPDLGGHVTRCQVWFSDWNPKTKPVFGPSFSNHSSAITPTPSISILAHSLLFWRVFDPLTRRWNSSDEKLVRWISAHVFFQI